MNVKGFLLRSDLAIGLSNIGEITMRHARDNDGFRLDASLFLFDPT